MEYFRFKRFLIVGLLSTALNYSVFFLTFRFLDVRYLVSGFIGYISGMLLGFVFNKNWSFQNKSKFKIYNLLLYFMIYLGSLVINLLVLDFSVIYMEISPLFANVIGITISTMTNYIGCSLIVFKKLEIS